VKVLAVNKKKKIYTNDTRQRVLKKSARIEKSTDHSGREGKRIVGERGTHANILSEDVHEKWVHLADVEKSVPRLTLKKGISLGTTRISLVPASCRRVDDERERTYCLAPQTTPARGDIVAETRRSRRLDRAQWLRKTHFGHRNLLVGGEAEQRSEERKSCVSKGKGC